MGIVRAKYKVIKELFTKKIVLNCQIKKDYLQMNEKFKTLFFVKSSLISLYLAFTIPIPFISIDKLNINSFKLPD